MAATKRILFLGGTGVISTASVALAVERGHDVTVLNRGKTTKRRTPVGVEVLEGDLRNPESLDAALGDREFDVVADFLSFVPEQLQPHVDRFRDRTGQFVFISSASAYQKPPRHVPVTESTPLTNPFWQYSRDKIACEDLLVSAYRETGFPATIVRPSHTYDATNLPTLGGWTDIARMRAGKPVVVHGDGTSLWTLTHSRDFAVGFVGLLGRPEAVGDAFHIMGDSTPTWNQVYEWLGAAAGATPEIVHVTSDEIAAEIPSQGPGLVGDKAHSMLFDCSKVKALVPEFTTTVPYSDGAVEQVAWYDAHPEAQTVDAELDAAFDRLVDRHRIR